jgi:FixJ family two-component response regulator
VVDDEADVLAIINDTVGRELPCKMLQARSLAEAQEILENEDVELLVADVHLPDGDGTALLPLLRKDHPQANAIVISGSPSVDGAIAALRHGAVDFLTKPFTATDLTDRVAKALKRQAALVKHERRLVKLRDAVRRLNDARHVVTKKVDLLCNDLISAYGELSKQLDLVRTQEGFKNFVGDITDLEQLLCHTMDYLMRQMGYSNIAIWLAGEQPSEFQLGAYMKYTIAGEDDLTAAMKDGIVKLADKEGFVRLSGDEAQEKLSEQELDYLADQDILAVNCTYLGETLAVVVVFRDAKKGFVDADVGTLKSVSPLFAISLAGIVRAAQSEAGEDDGDTEVEDDDHGISDEYDQDVDPKEAKRRRERKKKERRDDDWWKKGEAPPF